MFANRVNYRRKQMGVEKIKLDSEEIKKQVTKPRINYWIIRANQYKEIARGYADLAKMQQETRNDINVVASYMAAVNNFMGLAKQMEVRINNPHYPQYTVEA